MRFSYHLLTNISWFFLRIIALFNSKIRLFVKGRKTVFKVLSDKIQKQDRTIWIHAASLGEYEQGLPIIEQLKDTYPEHKMVLTFFSPSGYEVKKDSSPVDVVTYLPMDTLGNAKKLAQLIRPELAIFIKYEVWPNYLSELQTRNIPTLLVSAIFNERQAYFKFYGRFLRKALGCFTHIFAQDQQSKSLLQSLGLEQISVGGDTRFDRVTRILQQDNSLDFMTEFKDNNKCFVAGSTWRPDEDIIIDYINSAETQLKYVIAPHTIKSKTIQKLQKSITKKTVCFSSIKGSNLKETQVLIIDTIGLLTKIYSYADISYVGGGFETGLHNTLEPAVFGKAVIIGPNYHGFKEAEDLVALGGILPIQDQHDFEGMMQELQQDPVFAQETGGINKKYIQDQLGATTTIMDYIKTVINQE